LFLKFEEKFHASAAVTAWVPSISSGLRLSLGMYLYIYHFRSGWE
jgi:hypothetical protein